MEAFVRIVGVITQSKYKLEEFENAFSLYGITVIQIDKNANLEEIFKMSTPRRPLKDILREETALTDQFGDPPAMEHLAQVVHHSKLYLYQMETDGSIKTTIYTAETNGFIDYTKRTNNNHYDWDDIFCIRQTGDSYLENSQKGKKVSSRDKVISKFIQSQIHYKKLTHFIYNPQNQNEVVDFNHNLMSFFTQVPSFNTVFMKESNLYNIIIKMCNQGAFARASSNRREKNYWVPGLNAGYPYVPKPKELYHELTFCFHDASHFTMPDLVYDAGTKHPPHLMRSVYLVSRLISECVTLVLADMMFVNSLFESGLDYQTVGQRKIYPIMQAIKKKHSNPISIIYYILKGSYEYCFYQDTFQWKQLMYPEDSKCLDEFSKKFDTFFIADFAWSNDNYNDMTKHSNEFKIWWESVKHWRNYGVNLELESITEFIDNNELHIQYSNNKELFDKIFNCIFKKYIEPLFVTRMKFDTIENQRQNAFIRYMMGQSLIFFKEGEHYGIGQFNFETINRTMEYIRNKNDFSILQINRIRDFYNLFLKELQKNNVITPDDEIIFSQVYPIFRPNYVNYDYGKKNVELKDFVKGMLN
jgi:hypothetical protein